MVFPFVGRRGLATLLFASVVALPGCALFSGKPALPRHASIERGVAPSGGTDFAALVADAEVIYFPAERVASGARSEPAALLLDALLQRGTAFALGWDLIEASQQLLLDELPGKTGGSREELLGRLELAGTGRAREHCRAVLRDIRLTGIQSLGLRCPEVVLRKIAVRERLTAEEEKQAPGGYAPPRGGFEAYAEQLSGSAQSEDGLTVSYRAHIASQQFAAERIVRHFRGSGSGGKLLVFLRASDLEAGRGVPRYVAQKLQVRQLVLDSSGSAPVRAKLLALQGRIGGAF